MTDLETATAVTERQCDCHSYNWDFGTTPAELMSPPPDLIEKIMSYRPGCSKEISIDACIVEHVQALWDAGCVTLSSCCGHNRVPPSIVIDEHHTSAEAAMFAAVLAVIDDRPWGMAQWQHPTDLNADAVIHHSGDRVLVNVGLLSTGKATGMTDTFVWDGTSGRLFELARVFEEIGMVVSFKNNAWTPLNNDYPNPPRRSLSIYRHAEKNKPPTELLGIISLGARVRIEDGSFIILPPEETK